MAVTLILSEFEYQSLDYNTPDEVYYKNINKSSRFYPGEQPKGC